MSECTTKYEFRQPVEVNVAGEWRKGVVESPTSTFKHEANGVVAFTMWIGKDGGYGTGWCKPNEIRPDPDFALVPAATPRTGWRLPEPGDVVRVKDDAQVHDFWKGVDLTLQPLYDGQEYSLSIPASRLGSPGSYAFFDASRLELVRLRDAPQPEPAPEPPASKPRSNKQDIIDNAKLEMAAVTLEQDGHDHIAAMLRDLKRDWGES